MFKFASQIVFGTMFVAAGCLHFVFPAQYVKIMPPALPLPSLLVYVSGVCEIVLGAGLFTRFAPWAAWGLVALLIAVFPANVYMARHPELFPKIPPAALWARLPLQLPLIAWAWCYTRG